METGHNKNVSNFETVTIILNGLGAAYNPNQALIQLTNLQNRLTEAKAVMASLDTVQASKTIAIDERQDTFRDLNKYVVNVKRTAEVEVNDTAFTKDLQTIVRKFQSQRRDAEPQPDTNGTPPEPVRARSTSQRSFDNQIAHLTDLVALLRTKEGIYRPNDAEFTIASVESRIAALEEKNNAAKTANATVGTQMDARDRVLYDPETGLLKLVKLIKTQLARKPGRESAAYQQIVALEFRRY